MMLFFVYGKRFLVCKSLWLTQKKKNDTIDLNISVLYY